MIVQCVDKEDIIAAVKICKENYFDILKLKNDKNGFYVCELYKGFRCAKKYDTVEDLINLYENYYIVELKKCEYNLICEENDFKNTFTIL